MKTIDYVSNKIINCQRDTYDYKHFNLVDFDEDLVQLSEDLSKDKQVNTLYFQRLDASKDYLRSSLSIFDHLNIRLCDVKAFKNKSAVHLVRFKKYNHIISDIVEDNIVYTHPGNINISLTPGAHIGMNFSGSVNAGGFYFSNRGNEPVFSDIKVQMSEKKAAACSYAHEIAHTQLFVGAGRCDNYLNSELIPILVEELVAYNIDRSANTFRSERLKRLKALSIDLKNFHTGTIISPYYDKLESSAYIQSTIQAIALMGIYLANDKSVKKEMCKYIDDIFGYNKSVDDMLNYYGCNLDQISKDIKLLKKTKF